MNKKDELVLGTLAGVELILSPEHYKEYKGTLQEQIKNLQDQLQQKENIIKEVREYIEEHIAIFKSGNMLVDMNVDELLEILDKVD